jgi:hypothetical protein
MMPQNSAGQKVYLLGDGPSASSGQSLGSIHQVISATTIVSQPDFDL